MCSNPLQPFVTSRHEPALPKGIGMSGKLLGACVKYNVLLRFIAQR